MKRILMLALLAAGSALAQAPTGTPYMTRAVHDFSNLERRLLDAVQQRDAKALEKLLDDRFELRAATQPGRPVARAEWLRRVLSQPAFESEIGQMAVHEHADLMVVSYQWRIKPPAGSGLADRLFVVDTWQRSADGWRASVRYVAPVAAEANWKSIPGADFSEPEIPKRQ